MCALEADQVVIGGVIIAWVYWIGPLFDFAADECVLVDYFFMLQIVNIVLAVLRIIIRAAFFPMPFGFWPFKLQDFYSQAAYFVI